MIFSSKRVSRDNLPGDGVSAALFSIFTIYGKAWRKKKLRTHLKFAKLYQNLNFHKTSTIKTIFDF